MLTKLIQPMKQSVAPVKIITHRMFSAANVASNLPN